MINSNLVNRTIHLGITSSSLVYRIVRLGNNQLESCAVYRAVPALRLSITVSNGSQILLPESVFGCIPIEKQKLKRAFQLIQTYSNSQCNF